MRHALLAALLLAVTALPARAAPASVLMLGEVHDNAAGHAARLDLLRARVDAGLRPALATGIDLLRSASVVHLIGGGFVNDLWPHHLGVVSAAGAASAAAAARRAFRASARPWPPAFPPRARRARPRSPPAASRQ